MPIGMSRCGFFASCAAVETASNPMYAKNTTPAPLRIPEKPNEPNSPVFGGMKGCQLSVLMNPAQATRNVRTTATLITTIHEVKLADSLTPTTSSVVTPATTTTA